MIIEKPIVAIQGTLEYLLNRLAKIYTFNNIQKLGSTLAALKIIFPKLIPYQKMEFQFLET